MKQIYMVFKMLQEAKYNNKVDIWSLGCIIYELFNLESYFKDIFIKEYVEPKSYYPIKIDKKYNTEWLKLLNKILIKNDYNARLNIDEICDFIDFINILQKKKLIREIISKMKLLLKDSEFEMKKLKIDSKKKQQKCLNKKIEILNDLLKTQNEKILYEIDKEIKTNSFDLRDKLYNYLRNIIIKSKELIAQPKNIFNKISIEKEIDIYTIFGVNYDIGDELYKEIIISSVGNQAIAKRNGFLGIFKLLRSVWKDYNYYWNVIDLLKRTYSDKVDKILNVFYSKLKYYINPVIEQLEIKESILDIELKKEKYLIC